MKKKNVICLVIDRLQAGSLGVYGNTWLDTPHWNRLACDSLVCDFAFSDCDDLTDAYDTYWFGTDNKILKQTTTPPESLPARLAQQDYQTILLTDEPEVANHQAAKQFDTIHILQYPESSSVVQTLEETGFAKLIAAADELLQEAKAPMFLWIHSRGMNGPWDAPYHFRHQFVEEEDPAPDDSSLIPSISLADDHDDDEILLHRFRYSGQVACIDQCLGIFFDSLQESHFSDNSLLMVTSPRGFPLGEHRQIGQPGKATLYEEQTHIPWLLRFSDQPNSSGRIDQLLHPYDLFPTLLDWLNISNPTEKPFLPNAGPASILPLIEHPSTSWRDRLILQANDHQLAIRSTAWYLIETDPQQSSQQSPQQWQLFVKPDDRWEVSNVVNRCQEIAARLSQAIQTDLQAIADGKPENLAILEPELYRAVD